MDMLLHWCENERLEWDEKLKTAFGYYGGFPFAASSTKHDYLLCVFCKDKNETDFSHINSSPEIEYKNGRLTYTIPQEKSPSLMYIASAAEHLCRIARSAGLLPMHCEVCGGCENLRVWKSKNEYGVLCINCREKQAEAEKLTVTAPVSPTRRNIAGAAIGALIAFIFYTLIYQIGNFAPLAGAAAALFICSGYGRKDTCVFTKRSLSMCSLIGLFTILAAQTAALWLTLFTTNMRGGYGMFDTLLMLPRFLMYPGVMRTAIFEIFTAFVPMLLITLWWYLRGKKRKR